MLPILANPIVLASFLAALHHLITGTAIGSAIGSATPQTTALKTTPREAATATATAARTEGKRRRTMAPFRLTYIDGEAVPDDVRSELAAAPVPTVLVAAASFAKRSASLLSDLEGFVEAEYGPEAEAEGGGGCCGGAPRPRVLVVRTDESDDLEELAIDLGLMDVPSFQVYGPGGGAPLARGQGGGCTLAAIRSGLQRAHGAAKNPGGGGDGGCCPSPQAASSSACCPDPSSSACCPDPQAAPAPAACCPDPGQAPSGGSCCVAPPPGNGAAAQPTEATDVLRLVQQSYANTANQTEACCVSVDPSLIGYTPEQILAAGKDSNLGLGCGNPLSFANLQKGETVVDLGSGAGIDCFLAAGPVGRTGTVIGVDMTPEMVHKARSNAAGRGAAASRVSFRLGEIENLPVADGAADCVMSNCVINLSPDKGRVFREIHRILRDGGRVAITDVIVRPERVIPERLKTAEALAC